MVTLIVLLLVFRPWINDSGENGGTVQTEPEQPKNGIEEPQTLIPETIPVYNISISYDGKGITFPEAGEYNYYEESRGTNYDRCFN